MTRLAIPVFPLPDGEPSPRQQLIATLARIDGWGQGAWREIHATWRLRGGTLVIDDLEAGVSRDPDDRVVAATLVLERHGLGAAREHDDATCDWVLRLLWRSLMPRLRLTATCHQPAASIRSVNACVLTPPRPGAPPGLVVRLLVRLPMAGMCCDGKRFAGFVRQLEDFAA